MSYFKNIVKTGFRSISAKIEGAKLLEKVFGDKIEDLDFQTWLASEFKLQDVGDLISFLDYRYYDETSFSKRGPKMASVETRQDVPIGRIIVNIVHIEVMIII